MKIKTDYILLLVIVVLSFVLFRKCESSTIVEEKVITKIDTLHTYSVDTVMFKDTIYKIKIVKVTEPVIQVNETDSTDSTYTYNLNVNDSLLEGTITTVTKGRLLSQDFKYKPLFPKYIYRTDTFRINKETEITKNKYEIYIGSIIGGGKTNFILAPGISVRTTNKLILSGNYDIINSTVNLGVYTKLY